MQRSKQLAVSVVTATVLTAILPAFSPEAFPWVVMALVLLVLGRQVRRDAAATTEDRPASDG